MSKEIFEYRQEHTEKETMERFEISRSNLRQLLKTYRDENDIVPKGYFSPAALQEAVDSLRQSGGIKSVAAKTLGISDSSFSRRLDRAIQTNLITESEVQGLHVARLEKEVSSLRAMLKEVGDYRLTLAEVKKEIFGLKEIEPTLPAWLPIEQEDSGIGVPTLFLSDLHAGEVVSPAQINHSNAYDLSICENRLRLCTKKTIDLLKNHMVSPKYPGIVVATGGDMLSGDIHEELIATNQKDTITTLIDLFGYMTRVYLELADAFGKVFVPAVSGNHSRLTKKAWMKNYNATNFDSLLYVMLQRHFEALKDKRIKFFIPESRDALYSVYGRRYLLTHGDQFSASGDSIVGAVGPVIRGNYKKRSNYDQIQLKYDTLLLGHFHQLVFLENLIINGSVKGYDEYAFGKNLPYERPKQALWITRPDGEISFTMPVFLHEEKLKPTEKRWVTVFEE